MLTHSQTIKQSGKIKNWEAKFKPWLCIVALAGSQVVTIGVVFAFFKLFPSYIYWAATPSGTFFFTLLGGVAAFMVALFFTRPQSVSAFLNTFELRFDPNKIVVLAMVAGLILGLLGVLLAQIAPSGLENKSSLTRTFIHQKGPEKYLFLILLLMGPVIEEIIMRGFLYRNFRRIYSVITSVSVIALLSFLTHWNVMTTSVWAFLLLMTLQIILCLFFEKTRNLWSSIICHVAYNGALAASWIIGG